FPTRRSSDLDDLDVEVVGTDVAVDSGLLGVAFQIVISHARALLNAFATRSDHVEAVTARDGVDLDSVEGKAVLTTVETNAKQIARRERPLGNNLRGAQLLASHEGLLGRLPVDEGEINLRVFNSA